MNIGNIIPLIAMAVIVPFTLKKLFHFNWTWLISTTFFLNCMYWIFEIYHLASYGIYVARLVFGIGLCLLVFGSFIPSKPIHPSFLGLFIILSMTQLPTGVFIMSLAFLEIILIKKILSYSLNSIEDQTYAALSLSFCGYLSFFATGHQATFSSIQFQMGFVGLFEYNFYLSGLLVVLNSVGPFLLFHLAIAIMESRENTITKTVLLHHSLTTLISTIFAGYFRRHLMVWKVFAPRFMLSAIELILLHIMLLFARLINK